MQDLTIKRGIDLGNRFLASGLALRFQRTFDWWRGGSLNKTTFAFVAFAFLLNLYLVFPIFHRNVSPSFTPSSLFTFAFFLDHNGILSKESFFSALIIISLSLAPISFYLFVRKTVMGHELTAFIATLIYILPNPLVSSGSPLVAAVLNGDASHAVAFSFIPFFLLYKQAFIATGVSVWGVITAFVTACIAIISPFAMFNLLIFYAIITISEAFLGGLRIKVSRLFFLLTSSFALSFFWYYPNIMTKIILLRHVDYTFRQIMSLSPLLIPVLPVIGALSFLIFDRREKLKPIFIGLSLFLIYLVLYLISKNLNITGIFTPERYLIELSIGGSFFFAMFSIFIVELITRNYILKMKNNLVFFASLFVCFVIIMIIGSNLVINIIHAREYITEAQIMSTYSLGVGNIGRVFSFHDFSSVLAVSVSFLCFIFLMFVLIWSPSIMKIKEKEVRS